MKLETLNYIHKVLIENRNAKAMKNEDFVDSHLYYDFILKRELEEAIKVLEEFEENEW